MGRSQRTQTTPIRGRREEEYKLIFERKEGGAAIPATADEAHNEESDDDKSDLPTSEDDRSDYVKEKSKPCFFNSRFPISNVPTDHIIRVERAKSATPKTGVAVARDEDTDRDDNPLLYSIIHHSTPDIYSNNSEYDEEQSSSSQRTR